MDLMGSTNVFNLCAGAVGRVGYEAKIIKRIYQNVRKKYFCAGLIVGVAPGGTCGYGTRWKLVKNVYNGINGNRYGSASGILTVQLTSTEMN